VRRVTVVLLSMLAVSAASTRISSQSSAAGAKWSLDVTPLASPAGPNSGQPQLSVQGNRVVLSWIERSGDTAALRVSERTDGGWSDAKPSQQERTGL